MFRQLLLAPTDFAWVEPTLSAVDPEMSRRTIGSLWSISPALEELVKLGLKGSECAKNRDMKT